MCEARMVRRGQRLHPVAAQAPLPSTVKAGSTKSLWLEPAHSARSRCANSLPQLAGGAPVLLTVALSVGCPSRGGRWLTDSSVPWYIGATGEQVLEM